MKLIAPISSRRIEPDTGGLQSVGIVYDSWPRICCGRVDGLRLQDGFQAAQDSSAPNVGGTRSNHSDVVPAEIMSGILLQIEWIACVADRRGFLA